MESAPTPTLATKYDISATSTSNIRRNSNDKIDNAVNGHDAEPMATNLFNEYTEQALKHADELMKDIDAGLESPLVTPHVTAAGKVIRIHQCISK